MIPKSDIISADAYQAYIDLVKEEDVREAIEKNTLRFRKLLDTIPRKKFDFAYAEGKWTVREMLQHIIDCERVFTYRALRFSRMDPAPLPGFDEQLWGMHAGGDTRRWKDLRGEFETVREATEYLYKPLSDDQLGFVGSADARPLNAFTIGFIIPGHVAHHIRILKERYL